MFLKRIFSRPPPPEPRLEKFSLDSLRERITKLKMEKTENFRGQLGPIIDEINKGCTALSDSLRELSSSEPDGEIYPALLKSATEARKLLSEKVARAISGLGRSPDFSSEGLSTLDERISKTVNLTTDAISIHGRYVRSVFGQKFSAFEYHLRELHESIMRSHTIIEGAIKEIRALDSILSEIALQIQLIQESKKISDTIKSLDSRAKNIERLLKDESDRLVELKSSGEFKSANDSLKEINQIQQEINKAKGTAVSHISEMSRPFRKMEKLVISGGYSIGSESIKILKLCINNPVEVIASDENIAAFEKLLQETSELIITRKIELDNRDRRNKLDAAQRLAVELRGIKKNIANCNNQLEVRRVASENPVLGQAVKIEKLIAQYGYELREFQASIEELGKKSKLIDEELSSKRESLKKLVSDTMGVKVELTS